MIKSLLKIQAPDNHELIIISMSFKILQTFFTFEVGVFLHIILFHSPSIFIFFVHPQVEIRYRLVIKGKD